MARPSLTSRWACVQISKPSDIDNDSSSKNIPRDTGSGHRDQAPGDSRRPAWTSAVRMTKDFGEIRGCPRSFERPGKQEARLPLWRGQSWVEMENLLGFIELLLGDRAIRWIAGVMAISSSRVSWAR